jgi:hypothetical protein
VVPVGRIPADVMNPDVNQIPFLRFLEKAARKDGREHLGQHGEKIKPDHAIKALQSI